MLNIELHDLPPPPVPLQDIYPKEMKTGVKTKICA